VLIVGSFPVSEVWVGDRLWPEDQASISPFDHAVLTGDGVFETLKVDNGRPFALRRHLERLARSAAGLALAVPDPGRVRHAIEKVVAANGITSGRLRVTLTGGPGPLGSERGETGPTLIVAAGRQAPWPATADVAVCPWPRNDRGALAGLKTVSYAENVVALQWARARGADEAVFANLSGALCEGTGTNVFVGSGGRLLTPPLSSGCLAGVVRQLLLELEVAEEADLPVSTLAEAEEACLTSSTREIQPVRAVDGTALGATPGPLTQRAMDAFRSLREKTDDP
jgi:branched-chain amino acid aminotransferase